MFARILIYSIIGVITIADLFFAATGQDTITSQLRSTNVETDWLLCLLTAAALFHVWGIPLLRTVFHHFFH